MKLKSFLIYAIVTFLIMTLLSGLIYMFLGGELQLGDGLWAVFRGVLCAAYIANLFRTAWVYGKRGNSGGLFGLVITLILPLIHLIGVKLNSFLEFFLAPFVPFYVLAGWVDYTYIFQTVLAILIVLLWMLGRKKREVTQ